jgi:hypothetical protein
MACWISYTSINPIKIYFYAHEESDGTIAFVAGGYYWL